jgi:molecular chaperone DnaK
MGPAAEAHSAVARRLHELADARNTAESLAYQVDRTVKENREKLDESLASTIEGRVMELRGVLESTDVNEIRQKTQALETEWQQAAQQLYAQAAQQQTASAGGGGGNGAPTSDDEVVEEGEYEVIDEEEAKTS